MVWGPFLMAGGAAVLGIPVYLSQRGSMTEPAPVPDVQVELRQQRLMTFHVDSEVGQLKQAIVHRPGIELGRLTPENVDELLFDDVMWAHRAREEHDAFVAQLESRGVVVHHFADAARRGARRARGTRVPPGPADHGDPVRSGAGRAARRAGRLDTGRTARRPADRRRPQVATSPPLLHDAEPADGLPAPTTTSCCAPLPNHLFQRDNSAWIYDGVSINPMAKPARQARDDQLPGRLQLPPDVPRRRAPRSSTATTRSRHEPATIEGGDITVIGNRRGDDRHG